MILTVLDIWQIKLFMFDTNVNEGDTVVENEGITMVVDPMSMQYLSGAEVDYVEIRCYADRMPHNNAYHKDH